MTRSRTPLLVAALLALAPLALPTALAEPPAGGEGEKPAVQPEAEQPKAEKKRETTPEAEAALAKFANVLSLPTSAASSFACTATAALPMFGGSEVTILPTWTKKGGFDISARLPEEMTGQMPPEQVAMMEGMVASQFQQAFRYTFVSLASTAKAYHVSHKETKRGLRVELLPVTGDGVDWERLLCYFDDRGLVTSMTGIPRVDLNDPSAAMLAGTEVEAEFKYAERGKKFVIESLEVVTVTGGARLSIVYHAVEGKQALPKTITVETDMLAEPLEVAIHDYEIDGMKIAGTGRPEPTEEDAGTDGVKPATGDEKPTDK